MGVGHDIEPHRCCGDARERRGVNEVDPVPARQPAERVGLPFARVFSHRKPAARMVAAAGLRKLEGGQDRDSAEPVRVAEELEAGLDGLPVFEASYFFKITAYFAFSIFSFASFIFY